MWKLLKSFFEMHTPITPDKLMPPAPPPPAPRPDRVAQYADNRFRLLRRFALSRYASSYILRGSTVLRHWYGVQAREPEDLDLVAKYPHDPERTIAEVLEICHDTSLDRQVFSVERQNMQPMWEYVEFPGYASTSHPHGMDECRRCNWTSPTTTRRRCHAR
jgi:hypothetical protein